jgi:hypothetical protein
MSKEHVEWHNGKPSVVPDNTEPPGKKREILRGKFVIVEYTDSDGSTDTRLLLLGFEPENRKLVYELAGFALGDTLVGIIKQDSPGMAKE